MGEAGIEPTTPGLEGRCSIRLSYSPTLIIVASKSLVTNAVDRRPAASPSRRPLLAAPRSARDHYLTKHGQALPEPCFRKLQRWTAAREVDCRAQIIIAGDQSASDDDVHTAIPEEIWP